MTRACHYVVGGEHSVEGEAWEGDRVHARWISRSVKRGAHPHAKTNSSLTNGAPLIAHRVN